MENHSKVDKIYYNKFMKKFFIILVVLLLGHSWAFEIDKQNIGDHYTLLDYTTLKEGDQVNIGSLIGLGLEENTEGIVRIEFLRENMNQSFINDFFYKNNSELINKHTFSSRGIEPILTNDKFILQIHAGVTLHLRNDIADDTEYETFKNEEVIGTVSKVSGIVKYSYDPEKINKYHMDIFVILESKPPNNSEFPTQYILREDTYDSKFPKKYMPRIE